MARTVYLAQLMSVDPPGSALLCSKPSAELSTTSTSIVKTYKQIPGTFCSINREKMVVFMVSMKDRSKNKLGVTEVHFLKQINFISWQLVPWRQLAKLLRRNGYVKFSVRKNQNHILFVLGLYFLMFRFMNRWDPNNIQHENKMWEQILKLLWIGDFLLNRQYNQN